MITSLRSQYNRTFTDKKYADFLKDMDNEFSKKVEFRIAETPLFVDKHLKQHVLRGCDEIMNTVLSENYIRKTERAIPLNQFVPNETTRPLFLAFDFAVCKEKGEFTPRLIELQAFPSMFFWQDLVARKYRQHFSVPEGYDYLFSNLELNEYYDLMRRVIIGDHHPDNVVLIDIEPEKQKTWIDFYATRQHTGVQVKCISELKRQGKNLFYIQDGKMIPVYRIYNRVIFDELEKRKDLQCEFNLIEDVNVEWAGHPNWFFRISKFSMPFIKSEYVPETFFLHELKTIPSDLENYVLKPLFSFAGSGVQINVTLPMIEAIHDKENYILQRKVEYAEAFQSPSGPVKAELRILYVWIPGDEKPIPVINMARLSKGAMIGVDHNKNKDWVGGSVGFYERE